MDSGESSGNGHHKSHHRRHSSSSSSSRGNEKLIDTNEIRDNINKLRKMMHLTELKPNKTLSDYVKTNAISKPPDLEFDGKNYTIVSMKRICGDFSHKNPEKMIKEWMLDRDYRNILTSAGNYAAIEVVTVDECHKKIIILIASIFR